MLPVFSLHVFHVPALLLHSAEIHFLPAIIFNKQICFCRDPDPKNPVCTCKMFTVTWRQQTRCSSLLALEHNTIPHSLYLAVRTSSHHHVASVSMFWMWLFAFARAYHAWWWCGEIGLAWSIDIVTESLFGIKLPLSLRKWFEMPLDVIQCSLNKKLLMTLKTIWKCTQY